MRPPIACVLFAWLLSLAPHGGCKTARSDEDEGTLPRRERPRGQAPDADLLALVPDGASLVAIVDLEGLRRAAKGRPWTESAARSGAPLAGRLPGALGEELLARAKVLVLGLWLEEGGVGQMLLVARGGPEPARSEPPRSDPRPEGGTGTANAPGAAPPARKASLGLAALVRSRLGGRGKAIRWERYRGTEIAEGGEEATALPTDRTVVAGPTPLVKHAIDLLGEVPGFSSVREDRGLMALLRLVTGKAEGRAPALALVARFPDAVRGRLASRLGHRSAPLRGGLRLSLGEWVTLRAFVDCPDKEGAQAVIEGLRRAVSRAAGTDLVRRLGLAPLFKPLAVHQEGARVHGQWFVPMRVLDPYLTRVLGLLKMELPKDRPQAFPRPKDP